MLIYKFIVFHSKQAKTSCGSFGPQLLMDYTLETFLLQSSPKPIVFCDIIVLLCQADFPVSPLILENNKLWARVITHVQSLFLDHMYGYRGVMVYMAPTSEIVLTSQQTNINRMGTSLVFKQLTRHLITT